MRKRPYPGQGPPKHGQRLVRPIKDVELGVAVGGGIGALPGAAERIRDVLRKEAEVPSISQLRRPGGTFAHSGHSRKRRASLLVTIREPEPISTRRHRPCSIPPRSSRAYASQRMNLPILVALPKQHVQESSCCCT